MSQPADQRTLAALLHIAREALPQVDYLGEYRAKIISQNADGTCEVQPDDVRIPATSKVPIRYGTPGQSVKLKPGARAVIGFELAAADIPPRMVVTAWETASVEEATIEASSTLKLKAGVVELAYGAARNVACVGDFAQVGGPNPIPCTITLGAPGAPPAPVMTGAPLPAFLQFLVPVMAPIVSGSSGAKAP